MAASASALIAPAAMPRALVARPAPTADATPYCRLQSSSVCWGNTHRFLKVTANGPFDGINVDELGKPALGALDGEATLRRRPSIDTKLLPPFCVLSGDLDLGSVLEGDLDLVVGNDDGFALTYMENTGTSTAPAFVVRSGSANPFDGIGVGWVSRPALGDVDKDGTLRQWP